MLRSLTINKLQNYPNELKLNLLNHKFEFTSGLNIIVGRNGSGKTTLLKCIKNAYHLSDYNKCNEVGEAKIEPMSNIKYSIDFDFSPAINGDLFYNKSDDTTNRLDMGILDYVAAYDKTQISSGEYKMKAQMYLYEYIKNCDFSLFKKYNVNKCNDLLLVIDEPTLGMSAQIERKFFEYMKKWSEKIQIIIASNTIFGLGIDGVNYIETVEVFISDQYNFVSEWYNNIS